MKHDERREGLREFSRLRREATFRRNLESCERWWRIADSRRHLSIGDAFEDYDLSNTTILRVVLEEEPDE